MTKNEKRFASFFDITAHAAINVFFYFYFVISILIIIFYYLSFINVFKILFIIMICVYLLEMIIGFDRNFLGMSGIILFGIVGYLITNKTDGIMLGITYAILFINVLKVLLNLFINKTINKKY